MGARWAGVVQDLHQQAGLSTGAVTDNNELSSNLGHGDVVGCLGVYGVSEARFVKLLSEENVSK